MIGWLVTLIMLGVVLIVVDAIFGIVGGAMYNRSAFFRKVCKATNKLFTVLTVGILIIFGACMILLLVYLLFI